MADRFLPATDLDYLQKRAALKTFLEGQDRYRDWNFEGSNLSVLLDLLAHDGLLHAFLLNMVGSEMFQDTAELLDSQFSHSKDLNYVPRSRSSARCVVTLTVDVGNTDPGSVVVPRYHEFSSQGLDDDGTNATYRFTTDEALVVPKNALGVYQLSNVYAYEGRVVREVFVVNSSSKYVLQSANVDTTSVSVVVQASNTDTSNSEYSRADSLYGLDELSEVFFLQGAYDGRYEVLFGDDNLGRAVSNGNLVRVTYRDTIGDLGNGISRIDSVDSVDGYALEAEVEEAAYGGAERESIESIRFYAPRHFSTQERGVTKDDFKNLVRERFPQLEAVTAYGGEEVTPTQYGRVILSVKPYGDTVISNQLKSDILAYVNGKNAVTEPVIQDASFLYLEIRSTVSYDKDVTTKSRTQVASVARAAAIAWLSENLDDFGVDFKRSKLTTAIDDADPSITGNDTEVTLYKRWVPRTGSNQSLVFSFDNQLKDAIRFSDPINHDPIVWTTPFQYEKNGVLYDAVMQDDGDGTLFVYAVQNDGSRVVIEQSVGSVDYDTGSVSASLSITSYENRINVYGLTESDNVRVRANVFLTTEAATVVFEAVPDSEA